MGTIIMGTGSACPARVVANDRLAELVDTSDEWIVGRTGIRSRRISDGETAAQLAIEASAKALDDSKISASDIELIIAATSEADYRLPNMASLIQRGISASEAAGYDVNAACSGFLFALNTAHAFIEAGIYRRILVVGSEIMSRQVDWSDRTTCVLFGDGAGAVVVGDDMALSGIRDFIMNNDGNGAEALTGGERPINNFITKGRQVSEYIRMDGKAIFEFAVRKVPEVINQLLERNKLAASDVKYFILHQANIRILQLVAKKLNIEADKIPSNLENYGNTSAASIPILLDELNRSGQLKRGDMIVLSGFGAGLTCGATLIQW